MMVIKAFPELSGPWTRELLEDSVEVLEKVFVAQVTAALVALEEHSREAVAEAQKTLERISTVGFDMIAGKIDRRSAALSVEQYLAAVQLQGYRAANALAVEAFQRGLKLLEQFAALGLGFVEVLLQAAIPGAGALLHNVVTAVRIRRTVG